MNEPRMSESGWSPIPLALKILAVVMLLWMVGAAMNLTNLMENGLPLLGNFVFGALAATIVFVLDILGPVVFLSGLWLRKSWAVPWAVVYNGLFILNNSGAFLTVRDELGAPQLLVPTVASAIFLGIILWQRDYFRSGGAEHGD